VGKLSAVGQPMIQANSAFHPSRVGSSTPCIYMDNGSVNLY